MEDPSHDPYAAPTARVAETSASATAVYSPTQVSVGAFLGGPVGLVYFLHRNFVSLRNYSSATKTLLYGSAFTIVLAVLVPLLPDEFPNYPFSILYVVLGYSLSNKYQCTKQKIIDSPILSFRSNLGVFGASVLCFLASFAIVIGMFFLLQYLGVDV